MNWSDWDTTTEAYITYCSVVVSVKWRQWQVAGRWVGGTSPLWEVQSMCHPHHSRRHHSHCHRGHRHHGHRHQSHRHHGHRHWQHNIDLLSTVSSVSVCTTILNSLPSVLFASDELATFERVARPLAGSSSSSSSIDTNVEPPNTVFSCSQLNHESPLVCTALDYQASSQPGQIKEW